MKPIFVKEDARPDFEIDVLMQAAIRGLVLLRDYIIDDKAESPTGYDQRMPSVIRGVDIEQGEWLVQFLLEHDMLQVNYPALKYTTHNEVVKRRQLIASYCLLKRYSQEDNYVNAATMALAYILAGEGTLINVPRHLVQLIMEGIEQIHLIDEQGIPHNVLEEYREVRSNWKVYTA